MEKEYIAKLDHSKTGIENWRLLNDKEKDWWANYFELSDFTIEDTNKINHYKHDYGYHIGYEDAVRITFCIVFEILRYNRLYKMNRVFLGNSGGLDSAVVCGLLSRALKLGKGTGSEFEVFSYGLPLESNPQHGERSKEVAESFGLKHLVVDNLDRVYVVFKEVLVSLANTLNFNEEEIKRGLGNTKARLRMAVNFFSTTQSGSYVMSTDNLSELYMAFWTLMGDVGAFGPIQHILKGLEEPALAVALGVPGSVLEAKPTDGLNVHKSLDGEEGGDVDAFRGVRYPHLDAIICHATKNGLDLAKSITVHVGSNLIHSDVVTQEKIDYLVGQMVSPASVWKRIHGSIGTSISRHDLGLENLIKIAEKLGR